MKTSISISVLLLMFCACRQRLYKPAEYVHYVQDEKNGLTKKISIDGWDYEMQYRPYDYIILSEMRGKPNDSFKRARLLQLQGTAWFYIRFKKENSHESPLRIGISGIQDYQDRYVYYTAKAMNDIALVYDHDTIRPMSYVFETSYNVAPYESMLVGFELKDGEKQPVKNMQLVFFDRVFKNGIIKTTFSKEVLKELQNIKVAI